MFRLVAFDMDGTLIDVESSWAAVHAYFGDHNTDGLRRFEAGEIDDHEFLRTDVRIWKKHRPDLTRADLEGILATVPLMTGARRLLDAVRASGSTTAIISGGIDVLAERVGRELRIDRVLANGFQVDPAGRITGDGIIRVPIHGKRGVLEALQRELGISVEETASVGNSEIDVGLFERSRVGIAFHPEDEKVRAGATYVAKTRDLAELIPLLAGPAGNSFSRTPP
jgi:phosphoserine phosphatase